MTCAGALPSLMLSGEPSAQAPFVAHRPGGDGGGPSEPPSAVADDFGRLEVDYVLGDVGRDVGEALQGPRDGQRV